MPIRAALCAKRRASCRKIRAFVASEILLTRDPSYIDVMRMKWWVGLLVAVSLAACGRKPMRAPAPPAPLPPPAVIIENTPTEEVPLPTPEAAESKSTPAPEEPLAVPDGSHPPEDEPAVDPTLAPDGGSDPFRSDTVDGNKTGSEIKDQILTLPTSD